jgi:hypothetical protein
VTGLPLPGFENVPDQDASFSLVLIIVDPTDIRKEYVRKRPHLAAIHQVAQRRGIFVYDRGGDRDSIMLLLFEQGSRWIICQPG